MNELAELFLFRMGLASVFLAIGAVITWGVLNAFRCQSPFVHRTTWCLVLAQSILVFQFPIAVPWELRAPSGEATDNFAVNSNSLAALDPVATNLTVPKAEVKYQVSRVIPELHWPTILLTLWAVGVLIVLGQWITRYVWFICHIQNQKCEHKQWSQEWAELLTERKIVSHIPLYMSRGVGPLLCRWPNGHWRNECYCCIVTGVDAHRAWRFLPPIRSTMPWDKKRGKGEIPETTPLPFVPCGHYPGSTHGRYGLIHQRAWCVAYCGPIGASSSFDWL